MKVVVVSSVISVFLCEAYVRLGTCWLLLILPHHSLEDGGSGVVWWLASHRHLGICCAYCDYHSTHYYYLWVKMSVYFTLQVNKTFFLSYDTLVKYSDYFRVESFLRWQQTHKYVSGDNSPAYKMIVYMVIFLGMQKLKDCLKS